MRSKASRERAPVCACADGITWQLATANPNRDGTGTLGTVIAAAWTGTRVERVRIKATATVTAGMIRFFLFDGTNTRLIDEVAVTATTPSATDPAWQADVTISLILASGSTLKASTGKAETFNLAILEGGDLV